MGALWYGLETRRSDLLEVEEWTSNDLESLSRFPPLSDSVFVIASDKARAAIEKKSYKKAAALIVAMGGWKGMSSQQLVDYQNSIRNVKVALATAALGSAAHAQANWPTRSIRMIVPLAAGSAVDAAARIVADKMSRDLGIPPLEQN